MCKRNFLHQKTVRNPCWETQLIASFLIMADVHTTEVRSFNMSRIRAKDTKPELIVRRFLFSQGFRYRLHDKKLKGKPDIVLAKYKTVIFIQGCFWHGHEGCRYFVVPKTRSEWWVDKINTNKSKDEVAFKELTDKGWKVLTIWECELKPKALKDTLARLLQNLIDKEQIANS